MLITILNSLQSLIGDLSRSSKDRVIKDLQQQLLNGKIKEKLKVRSGEKKTDVQMLHLMDTMKDLQDEAYEIVIRLFAKGKKEIEKKRENSKSKISDVCKLPFDTETDTDEEIIQKTTKYLTETLKDVIEYLHLDKEEKNYNFNKRIVNAKLQEKLNELKQSEEKLDIIWEIQQELYEKVLINYQILAGENGYYNNR